MIEKIEDYNFFYNIYSRMGPERSRKDDRNGIDRSRGSRDFVA